MTVSEIRRTGLEKVGEWNLGNPEHLTMTEDVDSRRNKNQIHDWTKKGDDNPFNGRHILVGTTKGKPYLSFSKRVSWFNML